MSTRAQIKLKTEDETVNTIYLYKHSDGYPEGVLPVLAPFVKRFFENRGADMPYLLCQIVRAFAVEDFKQTVKNSDPQVMSALKNNSLNFQYGQDYTGWGLDTCKHGDIDFLYEIDEAGQIFVNGKLHKGAV